MSKISKIKNFSKCKLIYYNYIKQCGKGKIIPYKGSKFIFNKKSKLNINGSLRVNANSIINNGRTTIIRLDENSEFIVNGNFSIYYGGDIICFKNAKLKIESGFCNSDVKIRCSKEINIGKNVAISHNVTIMDSDAHVIEEPNYEISKPINIEDNVWIGTRATILKGVTIGKGSIVAAGAIVTKDVPERCIVAGVPARVIKENVSWHNK